MKKISDDEYHAIDGSLSMKREYGVTPKGNPMSGRWVVRNAAGTMLDFDRYRNDLAEHFNLNLT